MSNFSRYMQSRWLESLMAEAAHWMSQDIEKTVYLCEELAASDAENAPVYNGILSEFGAVRYAPVQSRPTPPPTTKVDPYLDPKIMRRVTNLQRQAATWKKQYSDLRNSVVGKRGNDPQSLLDMLRHVYQHISTIPNINKSYAPALETIIRGLQTMINHDGQPTPDASVPEPSIDDRAATDKNWAIARWLISRGVKGDPNDVYATVKSILGRVDREVKKMSDMGAGGHLNNEKLRGRVLQAKALHDLVPQVSPLGQEVIRHLLDTPALQNVDPSNAYESGEAPEDWNAATPFVPSPTKKNAVPGNVINTDGLKREIEAVDRDDDDAIADVMEKHAPNWTGHEKQLADFTRLVLNHVREFKDQNAGQNPSIQKLTSLIKQAKKHIFNGMLKDPNYMPDSSKISEQMLDDLLVNVAHVAKILYPPNKRAAKKLAIAASPPEPQKAEPRRDRYQKSGNDWRADRDYNIHDPRESTENLQEASAYVRMISVLAGVNRGS